AVAATLVPTVAFASGRHGPIATPRDALVASAAVVEGEVTEIFYTYDEREGPRTVVTLSGVSVHLGEYEEDFVDIAYLGGPLPDGRYLNVSELPTFAFGQRYLVFLHEGGWFYSPVVTTHAYRLEKGPSGDDVV